MGWVGISMEETHGDRFDPLRSELLRDRARLRTIKRSQDVTSKITAFCHLKY